MTDHAARSVALVDAAVQAPAQPRRLVSGWLTRLRAMTAPRWWEELMVVAASYGIYTFVRDELPTRDAVALLRAVSVLHFEQRLHVSFELTINHFLAGVHWLAVGSDYYYSTLHFVVTVGVLVWLYRCHPLRYRRIRSVLFATTLIALAGFWIYPLAPPRMLTRFGFVDTVVRDHTWGSWGSSGVAHVSNQFAAMPSLHVAWALWCAVVVIQLSRRWWVRSLAALYPVGTVFVVLGTANHFLLDAVGGAVCLLAGFVAQRLLSGKPAFAVEPMLLPLRGQA
jgi:hypothetical protein